MGPTPAAGRLVVLAACLAAAPVAAPRAQPGSPAPGTPIAIGEARTIPSTVMGEDREVLVALPEAYGRTAVAYPVLYVLDGSSHLLHATATTRFLAGARNRVPDMIVVAIPNTNRTRDLTPGPGASRFQRFLADELIPWVERHYRAAPERILVGHSLGGSFAVHTMLKRVELFDAYVSASAPLWRYDSLARDARDGLPRAARAKAALHLTVGEHEHERLREGIARFVAQHLEGADSTAVPAWSYAVLEDDDHSSTPSRSLYDALEARYAPWRFPFFEDTTGLRQAGGLKGLEDHYARFSRRFGYRAPPPESRLMQVGRLSIAAGRHDETLRLARAYLADYPGMSESLINAAGYDQLRRGQGAEAVRTFRTNVELFPDSPNVYDSLGDACCRTGAAAAGRRSYEQAAEVAARRSHPRLPFYRAKIERGCSAA